MKDSIIKDYIKENWRFLFFVLTSGLIGGYCIGLYLPEMYSQEMLQQQMFFVQRLTGSVFWLSVSKIRNWLCNDSSWRCSFNFRFADDIVYIDAASDFIDIFGQKGKKAKMSVKSSCCVWICGCGCILKSFFRAITPFERFDP